LLPELSVLVNGFPAFASLRPLVDSRLLKLEDEMKEGVYEVRAELPGVEPTTSRSSVRPADVKAGASTGG
jgi:hypothetical protein